MKDNIEIIDEELDEIIDIDDSTTYENDDSLKTMNEVNLGNTSLGTSTDDALKSFNTDETLTHLVVPKEEIIDIKEERPNIYVENPDLNSDLDNTLLLARQAIKPEETEKEVKHEESDNGAIIFIIILFLLLTAFIVALPYITDLFN